MKIRKIILVSLNFVMVSCLLTGCQSASDQDVQKSTLVKNVQEPVWFKKVQRPAVDKDVQLPILDQYALDIWTFRNIWRFDGVRTRGIICKFGFSSPPKVDKDKSIKEAAARKYRESQKSIILDQHSETFRYGQAAEILYHSLRDSEKDFLLANLNTKIDTTDGRFIYWAFWEKIYTDTYIKGLLGDSSAVGKMDSIARHCPHERIRIKAVSKMAEAGILNYYNFVREGYFSKSKYYFKKLFALYARDQRYRDDVIEVLKKNIDNGEDSRERMLSALFLSNLDGELTKEE